MPPTQSLAALRHHLRDLLVENPADALKELQALLPAYSDKQRTVTSLLGELNDTNKKALRGTLSDQALQRAYNRLREAVLDLIDSLDESDFTKSTPGQDRGNSRRQGEILYRIPHSMPMQCETRCIVRIALDAGAIVEDVVLDEHVTIKPLTRVSDLMEVDLVDPSANGVFQIRAINSPEQLIEEESYTEWQFYVMPLREGIFPLLIKVSVIELLHGKERKKEIVLTEQIEIRANDVPATSAVEALKSAGQTLVFSAAPQPIVAPRPEVESRRTTPHGLRAAALFLALLVLGAGTTWAFAPQEMRWIVTLVQNTPEAYVAYAQDFPGSRHREKAVYRQAKLIDTPIAYQGYLMDSTLRGEYKTHVLERLKVLETKAIEEIRQSPTAPKVLTFLENYPTSDYLETVAHIVDTVPSLKRDVGHLVQQLLEKRNESNSKKVNPDRSSDSQQNHETSLDVRGKDRNRSGGEKEHSPHVVRPGLPVEPNSKKSDSTPSSPAKIMEEVSTPVANTTSEPADSLAWQAALKRNDRTAYEAFLTQYPSSRYADAVRSKLSAAASPAKIPEDMVFVKGGTFQMGSREGQTDEQPVHPVTVGDFYISKYEVTQQEWRRIMGTYPRDLAFKGCDQCPVENVNWYDVQNFIKILNSRTGLNFRLPTEAEWEFAARGGNKMQGYTYAGSHDGQKVGWFYLNSKRKTHPVGELKGNELGLFDMTGNVYEWCSDWYAPEYYRNKTLNNPLGPSSPTAHKVARGGSWDDRMGGRRVTYRHFEVPQIRRADIGFRLVLDP